MYESLSGHELRVGSDSSGIFKEFSTPEASSYHQVSSYHYEKR